jgi:hypothetical protein
VRGDRSYDLPRKRSVSWLLVVSFKEMGEDSPEEAVALGVGNGSRMAGVDCPLFRHPVVTEEVGFADVGGT